MARYGFTPQMCADKSANELLYLAHMLVAHRRYQGVLEADEIIRLSEMEKLVNELRSVN
jgi:hypothetical protein